ncbi:fibronectin type III domain-containing protein [Bacillus horti]|uniref:Fibronectin type-III domain-containing protein n=1 Tax=Caldalkalibacillus horti TaxID=77523 RepID=A0ABT9W058_9BACI|nr:fibronectin type III domain-containing protein [Bacillus horti]MDQ0166619.1 hypothetical protein [Bacillus horti]
MPFIDTTPALSEYKIKEGNVQEALGKLLEAQGWTIALTFKKAVTTAHFLSNGHPESARHNEIFAVAQHYIYQNAKGKMLGLAIAAEFTEFTNHHMGVPFYNMMGGTTEQKNSMITWLVNKFEDNKVNTSLYYYMVEELPEIENETTLLVPYGGSNINDSDPNNPYRPTDADTILRMALDCEVVETDYATSSQGSLYIKRADPMIMQSPIVKSSLRPNFTEDVSHPFMRTNWWEDSEISLRGYIDSENIFVVLQADNVPAWENNIIPTVPLYFGNIVPLDKGDEEVALFAGTVPPGTNEDQVATYDFDGIVRGGDRIMPILKNYPRHPSNGVDTVMLSRSKFGARYQEYFLSWNAAPNEMPPARQGVNGRKKYQRAYQNFDTTNYKFQFNPSRYSNKIHTSRIYVVHPEEGVRGHLNHSIGLNSTNFSAGKLRVRKENCPDKIFDVYKYVPISGLSPLTKRPGTAYRPMGLGIFESEVNTGEKTVQVNAKNTVQPAEPVDVRIESHSSGTVTLSWTNPSEDGFQSINIYLDSSEEKYASGVTAVNEYLISGLTSGDKHTVTIKAVDINGNESIGITTEEVTVL